MKKVFLSLFLASVVMVSFSSCEKGNKKDEPKAPNEISGTILSSESLSNASVYVEVSKGDDMVEVLGESKVINNKFNLTLKTPSIDMLENFDIDDGNGLTISDKDAKTMALLDGFIVKKENKNIGKIICSDISPLEFNKLVDGKNEINTISFVYSDRPVKMNGTFSERENETTTMKLDFKKGWNMIKLQQKQTTNSLSLTFSSISSIPSNYKWRFIGLRYID